MSSFDLARRKWREGNAKHWDVARLAYKLRSRKDMLKMADAIEKDEQTVRNLSDAYKLFVTLVLAAWKAKESCKPISNLRRKHPYTRWATVCRNWRIYEFDLDEAREWLEDFSGGNDAMDNEIQNKHGKSEADRRMDRIYREANKLQNDFGASERMRNAAAFYVSEYKIEFEVQK